MRSTLQSIIPADAEVTERGDSLIGPVLIVCKKTPTGLDLKQGSNPRRQSNRELALSHGSELEYNPSRHDDAPTYFSYKSLLEYGVLGKLTRLIPLQD